MFGLTSGPAAGARPQSAAGAVGWTQRRRRVVRSGAKSSDGLTFGKKHNGVNVPAGKRQVCFHLLTDDPHAYRRRVLDVFWS